MDRKWGEGLSLKENPDVFTMVIPPPNVTGKLHIGHALNNTFMDISLRRAILQGKNAILIPGTDHAGIATQCKVEKELHKKGIKKEDMTKDEFMEKVHEWKDEHGGHIISQLKEIGCLYAWNQEHFTMEPHFNKLVNDTFIKLYNDGLIYQGEYIVNWCTELQTAIANDEVVHVEKDSKMYYIKYECQDSEGNSAEPIMIATTRPETLLGDVAVAYNPDDERYKHLNECKCIVPFVNRMINFVADAHVSPELGTGLVKITPSHDFNDFEIGKRHNLKGIQVIDKHGHICNTKTEFDGMFKTKARRIIVEKLKEMGMFVKEETHKNKIGTCYRSGDILEPMVSKQWFVRMKPLAEKAKAMVDSGEIELVPDKHRKIYNHWMDNIRDWCISRQIWWGHRIPVWYHKDTGEIKCQAESPGNDYEQDPDVLDTWFSSWLWPLGVIKSEEFDARFPTDLLVTGSDILFFWVARMIMAAGYLDGRAPFKRVYLHGIVRDALGEKISKSKGNVIDPLDVRDKYGTDAMRLLFAMHTTMDRDISYSPQKLKICRNFLTKLWNTVRFYKMGFATDTLSGTKGLSSADYHAVKTFNNLIDTVNRGIDSNNYALYTTEVYGFIFNYFCNHYLEYCKVMELSDESKTLFHNMLSNVLIILHPVIPFITEELYCILVGIDQREPDKSILEAKWPAHYTYESTGGVEDFDLTLDLLQKHRSGVDINNKIDTLSHESNRNYLRKIIA
jgi:valyl-tRNA synthetase